MNIYGNSATPGFTESTFSSAYKPAFPSKKIALLEDEAIEFSTIDGDVVTYNAGSHAVSSGSGIFIGDYFVGITDNYSSLQTPFVRY